VSSGDERHELGDTLTFGDVRIDLAAHTAQRADIRVSLTPKAFELLLALARRKGNVASRAELLREVWGYDPLVQSRTVDSHIAQLRRKLDDPAAPRHFLTVWKMGYLLVRGAPDLRSSWCRDH
jgi:two-component system alkaline phosphatase synthesis response regulator PhoP